MCESIYLPMRNQSQLKGPTRLSRYCFYFEAEFLYYKISISLTIFFGYTMIHVARISRNADFCLPQKTR